MSAIDPQRVRNLMAQNRADEPSWWERLATDVGNAVLPERLERDIDAPSLQERVKEAYSKKGPEPVAPEPVAPEPVAPEPAKPQLGSKKPSKAKIGGSKKASTPAPKNPTPAWQRTLSNLEELEKTGLEQQKDLSDRLRKEIDNVKKSPKQVDLSALMRLADAWGGSNMAAGYKDPNAAREKKLEGLQKRLQANLSDVSDTEVAMLRGRLKKELGMAQLGAKGTKKDGLTPLQLEAEKTFGKKMDEYREDVFKSDGDMALLGDLLGKLTGPDAHKYGGRFTGNEMYLRYAPKLLGGSKETLGFKQDIDRITQQNLKKILGAQFTEKEATALLERGYDPTLPPEVAAERIQSTLDLIQRSTDMKKMQLKHVEQYGEVSSFYKTPEYQEYLRDAQEMRAEARRLIHGKSKKNLAEGMPDYRNMTDEQLQKLRGYKG